MGSQKVKRYRLSVSLTFPKTHPRKGEATFFVEKTYTGYGISRKYWALLFLPTTPRCSESVIFLPKIHTIRGNYERWKERMDEVQKGKAVIELFYWSGSPYNSKHDGSKQVVFATLDKYSGCGIQKMDASNLPYYLIDDNYCINIRTDAIANNDGLNPGDFSDWLSTYDLNKPMAIIHFTSKRYTTNG